MTRNVSNTRRQCAVWLSVVALGSWGPAALPLGAQTWDAPPRTLADEDLEALENELLDSDQAATDGDDHEEGNTNGLRRFLPRWRGGDVNERNHRSVRAAFREVVETARQSTVQVLCDGERVAMGTVVAANGYILTKASEIDGDVECRLADGRRLAATVHRVDDDLDLAILHVEADDLVPVAWRPEGVPSEGSWLATTGIQELPAAVGVVSVSPRPVPMPKAVLGVMLGDLEAGTTITNVVPESAAADAGIELNDIVLELDGKHIASSSAFVQAIRHKRPGQKVVVKIKRGQQQKTLTATLQEFDSLAQGRRVSFQNSLGGRLSTRRWGFPSVIQHDTVLRPSDCGGPVVDLDGYVVGINIARAGRVASYALPADVISPLLQGLEVGPSDSQFADSGPARETRIEELRIAVQDWTTRFSELQQKLDEARGHDGESVGAGSAQTLDEAVAKLELAAADAKSELEKALRALQELETAGVTAVTK